MGENKTKKRPNAITTGVQLLQCLLNTPDENQRTALLHEYLAALIPPEELLNAIAQFVNAVRTVRSSDQVQEARKVAIAARLVILELYGEDSETLKQFESGLAPAFAPKCDSRPKVIEEEEEETEEATEPDEEEDPVVVSVASASNRKDFFDWTHIRRTADFFDWTQYWRPSRTERTTTASFNWKQWRKDQKRPRPKRKTKKPKSVVVGKSWWTALT